MSKNVESGFYAGKGRYDVFCYDADAHRAVWLRIGNLDLVKKHPELEWELPDEAGELKPFLERYGFEKLDHLQAMIALVDYTNKVKKMIDPQDNLETLLDPVEAIKFVTTIQALTKELGKSVVEGREL